MSHGKMAVYVSQMTFLPDLAQLSSHNHQMSLLNQTSAATKNHRTITFSDHNFHSLSFATAFSHFT